MAKKTKKATKTKAAKKAAKKSAPKSKSAKPAVKKAAASHTSIAVGLTANDAVASIGWYCDVLGFAVAERWEIDGVFRGSRVTSGNVSINIGQDDWKMGRDRVKGLGTRIYIHTGVNIDKYAADIKARGGNLDQEPADGWGVRSFSVSDPDGYKLTFMSPRK